MRLTQRDVAAPTEPAESSSWLAAQRWLPGLWSGHWPFLIALAGAAVVRLVVQIAFPPAFIHSDGPTYLHLVDALEPSTDRPVGYGVLLRGLSWITRDLTTVAITQHALGLFVAVLIYALLRRWDVSAWVATLATLPVLFDGMQLVLEHSVLSDVLFEFLLVLGLAVLAWRRQPSIKLAAIAGVVLGAAVLVRVVGQPVILGAALFCLLACSTARSRFVTTITVCAAFLAPLAAYATWYHHDHGVWALTEVGGRALYMRTTTFVDCEQLSLPSYEQTLCPDDPLGQRRDPTYYGWHDPTTVHALQPPPGVSADGALRDFALRAIRAQPLDYLGTGTRDFIMTFSRVRKDMFEYDDVYKWSFAHYVDYQPTPWTGPAYASHGGDQPWSRHPIADLMAKYGSFGYVPGPVLAALLLLALIGIVAPRRARASVTRPLAVLTTSLAIGLILLPDLTAEFSWRYLLPALVLLPMGGALGWTRLRGNRQSGTTATPSTD